MSKQPDVEQLCNGILQKKHGVVSQAITLIESDHPTHWGMSCELLTRLSRSSKRSFRLAISGPPGVGKSTFIEALGLEIVNGGKSLAVLAVDPSSQLSGGSILGDKTRMEKLSREKSAFIRPSPSRGHLGGVTETLPGTLAICEAAGFDFIIVETVGVGQSEVSVSGMVDHLTLLAQPGSGDDLQGIKKGVLEFVNSIVVNKIDLHPDSANQTQSHLQSAIKIMRGREIPVLKASALDGKGVAEFLEWVGSLEVEPGQRQAMNVEWFRSLLLSHFHYRLKTEPSWAQAISRLEGQVQSEGLLPMLAVQDFFSKILNA